MGGSLTTSVVGLATCYMEVGYKVAVESLTTDRRIEWCSGPPRVPPTHTLPPRQEIRDTLIGGPTSNPQSR